MADIRAHCPTCGKEMVVSEFARSVVCRACNASVTLGGSSSEKSKAAPELKFRSIERASSQAPDAKLGPNLKETAENIRQRTEKGDTGSRDWRNHPAASWVVFMLLGGLTGWMRYGNCLPPDYLEMMKSYGPYVALVLHVLITVRAFEDSILNGALCVLLPPYAYYYLFITSDFFMLRAVVAGFMAGIGLDTFIVVKAQSIAVYQAVTTWIGSGG
jgi:hypothetical protein